MYIVQICIFRIFSEIRYLPFKSSNYSKTDKCRALWLMVTVSRLVLPVPAVEFTADLQIKFVLLFSITGS
jgi:hypothetical protein